MSFIIFLISELSCLSLSEAERFIVCKMLSKCLDIVGCICRVFVCAHFILSLCGRIHAFDFLVPTKLSSMENMYFFFKSNTKAKENIIYRKTEAVKLQKVVFAYHILNKGQFFF